jgi:hypothetical protein
MGKFATVHIVPRGRLGEAASAAPIRIPSDVPALDVRSTAFAQVKDVTQPDELQKLGEPCTGAVKTERPPAA